MSEYEKILDERCKLHEETIQSLSIRLDIEHEYSAKTHIELQNTINTLRQEIEQLKQTSVAFEHSTSTERRTGNEEYRINKKLVVVSNAIGNEDADYRLESEDGVCYADGMMFEVANYFKKCVNK